ncbi:MAG: DUF4982 domain-containing protein, partial [Clostridia bacterium]|nr:DUF4982 domain-containing protein [Clostridia bacterium]
IGFRTLEFDKKRGFFVNGVYTKLNGVCMHHDMGAIGSAVNVSALRRQLRILAEMGCNSIRTSHNPPAPELLDLADELGFYIIDEQFDQWRHNKTANGYGLYFAEHAEADFVATLRRDRNHPSIIMWSLGNEIHDQSHADGGDTARWLADIVRREDPTRPTTCGFDRPDDAWKNGLIKAVDIVGLNYKPHFYQKFLDLFDMPIYGSENESCVSSRGVYYIPDKISAAEAKGDKDIDVKPWKYYPGVEIPAPCRETTDVSSYDLSAPPWAYYPEVEFAAQDDYPQIFGEYVWTGFDYLGEPTPYGSYGTGTKLTRSSYFGIVDLAGLPKDRYWSYQAKWTDKPVLHVFPHWNWEIGDVLPVHCYTSANRAELFVNGRSMGIREKNPAGNELERYRLIWDDVAFEPGEITVKAYDDAGNVIMRETIRTAGAPAKLELSADREVYAADGDDLCYVTVRVLDAEGNFCPKAATRLHFTADGCGEFLASDNGDQTDTEVFPSPYRNAFSGMAVGIFRTKCGCRGDLRIRVEADGMEPAVLTVKVR